MSAANSRSLSTGPAVVSESTWRALASIRHEHLLREMFGRVAMAQAAARAVQADGLALPEWLEVREAPEIELPPRLARVEGSDRHTLLLALHLKAAMTLLEGKGLLEKAKLSFIKSMSTVALIVQAYQTGQIRAAKPLLVALERKGHEMPPPEQMAALLAALDGLQ
ncbi:MAG: hypothetical protein IT430_16920 [Phycisphaerales bacterium]|nr:hypothetical protein [Phycisphaerales bacterium]